MHILSNVHFSLLYVAYFSFLPWCKTYFYKKEEMSCTLLETKQFYEYIIFIK